MDSILNIFFVMGYGVMGGIISYWITRLITRAYFRSKIEFLHEMAHHERAQCELNEPGIKA